VIATVGALWVYALGLLDAATPTEIAALAATTAAAAVLTALLAIVVRRAGQLTAPRPVPVRAHRATQHAHPPRLCDPDAPGRPRPRAPAEDRTA